MSKKTPPTQQEVLEAVEKGIILDYSDANPPDYEAMLEKQKDSDGDSAVNKHRSSES
ncbi:MAG: hypothetical protein K6T83_23245 [Alicyclobacillus sp.]|nr:hypothetical protein [Alicyclobacillus sp.]